MRALEVMRGLAWRTARRPALLCWAAFLLWETLGIRLVVLPRFPAAALVDDLSLLLGGLAVGAALELGPGWARGPLRLVLGAVLGFFNLANTLFFRFFDTYLNMGSYTALNQVPGASSSVRELLGARLFVLEVLVPLGLLAAVGWYSRGRAKRAPRAVWAGAGALGLALLHPLLAHATLLPSENNALMHVARQAAGRLYQQAQGRAALLEQVAAHRDEVYTPLDPSRFAWSGLKEYPLYRVPTGKREPKQKLNVVLVLMESFRAAETGIGTGKAELAPNLDKLAQQGVFTPRFYANAHQTVRGEFATLCGSLPNYGSGQIYSAYPDLSVTCLPEILAKHGYETHWVSAYDAEYGNKRTFLKHHGVQRVHDKHDLENWPRKKPVIGWGLADEDTADSLVDVLDHAQQPFFAEWMTLSNHHPFDWPYPVTTPDWVAKLSEKALYKNYLRGMHYTDAAVGHLMEVAKTRPWFKDTLFVFLGDHGAWIFAENGPRPLTPAEKMEIYFRDPLIMYSPEHLAPRKLEVVGGQVDVAPTILDVLGIDEAQSMDGTSLLGPAVAERRFAILGNENTWSIRQGDAYCYAVGQSCFKSMPPYCPSGFEEQKGGHSCFRYSGDLLDLNADRSGLTLLPEAESAALVDRARHMAEDNAALIMLDALVPHADALDGGAR